MAEIMDETRTVSLSLLPRPSATGHLLALALIGPFLSPLLGIWGPTANVGSVIWRFGAYGLLMGGQFYLFAALGVSGLVAAFMGQRRTLMGLSIVATILAVLFALGLPAFILDFLQLKRTMNATAFGPFKTTGIKVAAMAVVGIPILALIALVLRRAGRGFEPERKPRASPLAAAGK